MLETFHDSLDRCQQNPAFMDAFYERFLASSDEILALFKDVELVRVKAMVRQSFILIMLASEGSAHSINRLKTLGKKHIELSIQESHYDIWLDSLMSVVEEIDPYYSLEVESSWRAILSSGISHMKSAAHM